MKLMSFYKKNLAIVNSDDRIKKFKKTDIEEC